jgi:hypothetical protein
MNRHARQVRTCSVIVTIVFAAALALAAPIPGRLSDQQFWKLSSESSEPDGTFRSENLLSNELGFQYVIPELTRTAKQNRIYMGVGPEQNFTYIVALKPAMAFIVDIRRGNLDLHLMYKALFELSADRAEFLSRLFSRKRPEGLTSKSRAVELFDAFNRAQSSDALYKENLKAIEDHLTQKHGFALSTNDLAGIEYVYGYFYRYGPEINYGSSGGGFGGNFVTYGDLMVATDRPEAGVSRSFLATEENFAFLKEFETKNLLVPVVGNFAGPQAIRAVGRYLKENGGVVSAFYLSNVEQYLDMDGIWGNFCLNTASLPLDESSTFIRSVRGGAGFGFGGAGLTSQLGNIKEDLQPCTAQK